MHAIDFLLKMIGQLGRKQQVELHFRLRERLYPASNKPLPHESYAKRRPAQRVPQPA